MARALRIEPPGVWHHVTARGNERKAIFRTERDRAHFKDVMVASIERFGLLLHAWALMAGNVKEQPSLRQLQKRIGWKEVVVRLFVLFVGPRLDL